MRPDGIRGVVLDLDDTLTDLARFELEVWDETAKMLAGHFPQVDRDELRERYLAARLERLGYFPMVDEVAISAEIGAAKPDRGAYDAVAEMLDLPHGELVMVGDNWDWDVAGALDAGLAAAYYVGPDDPPERERAHVLESVADVPAALGLSA